MSSEAHLLYLQNNDFSVFHLLLVATIGNSLGSMTCYYIGRYGGRDLVGKIFKHDSEKIDLWKKRLNKKPEYWALLCWLPIVGELIATVLGLISNNSIKIFMLMFLGKLARYAVVLQIGEFVF